MILRSCRAVWEHSGACSACHSEWRAAGLRASLWRSRPAAEQRSPTRASGASNPEPGGLVDLKDLEGPRSCRRATCGAPPTASRHAARRAQRRPASRGRRAAAGSAAAPWAQQFAAPEMLPQGGASSPPRSTAAPETRRGAACGGDDDSSSGAGSWEERPGLLQARADGARRGALSGGGVRHMLMQISPLGDLVRQVIWGLCRAASRGAPGRRTSGAKSKYSEIPPAFV